MRGERYYMSVTPVLGSSPQWPSLLSSPSLIYRRGSWTMGRGGSGGVLSVSVSLCLSLSLFHTHFLSYIIYCSLLRLIYNSQFLARDSFLDRLSPCLWRWWWVLCWVLCWLNTPEHVTQFPWHESMWKHVDICNGRRMKKVWTKAQRGKCSCYFYLNWTQNKLTKRMTENETVLSGAETENNYPQNTGGKRIPKYFFSIRDDDRQLPLIENHTRPNTQK